MKWEMGICLFAFPTLLSAHLVLGNDGQLQAFWRRRLNDNLNAFQAPRFAALRGCVVECRHSTLHAKTGEERERASENRRC